MSTRLGVPTLKIYRHCLLLRVPFGLTRATTGKTHLGASFLEGNLKTKGKTRPFWGFPPKKDDAHFKAVPPAQSQAVHGVGARLLWAKWASWPLRSSPEAKIWPSGSPSWVTPPFSLVHVKGNLGGGEPEEEKNEKMEGWVSLGNTSSLYLIISFGLGMVSHLTTLCENQRFTAPVPTNPNHQLRDT